MARYRVVHYLNQFFAGVGGEERAGEPAGSRQGPVGPGTLLQALLADDAEVVATVYCGDNYLAERGGEALARVVDLIAPARPDVVVLGPAFASGRYGLACGQVAVAAREALGCPTVTGMHESNPAVEMYRARTCIVRTRDSAIGLREALVTMAALACKVAGGEPLGAAAEEGYFPTGRRVNRLVAERGARRAVRMLARRLRGDPFETEWDLPAYAPVVPASPVPDLRSATVALVSESGCVPRGNPDGIRSGWATSWARYPIAGVRDLRPAEWEFIHGGYDTTFVNDDPDRAVPVDVLREFEAGGRFHRLYDVVPMTCGNMVPLSVAVRFGQEIAAELCRAGVQACILTAT